MKQIKIVLTFIILQCFACTESVLPPLSTGHLHDGVYTNKCLNLCIEPEIYASIYSFNSHTNKLEEFGSKVINIGVEPLIPLVCLKDLIELRISLANEEIFGDFRNDRSIDYFKTTVSAHHEAKGESFEVELLASEQIAIDGKQFLSNYYHLHKNNRHTFEKQLFTYVDDRYLLFHLSDNQEIKHDQILDLFKAIKFDCI